MAERPATLVGAPAQQSGETAPPLLSVQQLSVHYVGQERWVLPGLDLEQLQGRLTAVIGPSGCGKTTLVRAICGLVPHCLPSEYTGSVRLGGVEIADATVDLLATRVAYVGQNPDAAVITRTVHDDVAFALQNLCLPSQEIKQRVHAALTAVGLAHAQWQNPWTLSGGQRQRLAIAVAVAMRPALLVLDEPTSTIDSAGRSEFYAIIAQLVSEGTAVVVIDHDLDPVLPICDQVIALDAQGALIARGTPREVFGEHASALAACGVWLPRALRQDPASSALTCAEAGIDLIGVDDVCGDQVRYLRRADTGWEDVAAIDTVGEDGPAALDLVDFSVPNRSPAISLRLQGGEFVALVGPNAAGKTSLLAALAGLTAQAATRALVGGKPVKRGRHQVGYVFQNPEHQLVAASVAGEIGVGGAPAAQVDAILAQFHLSAHRNQHPLTLSGGQIRRLSVATMVAESRQVIVLDEPTYGQDWANTCELMAFIDGLRAEGRTVLMATHDLELAFAHCSHIVALPAASVPAASAQTAPSQADCASALASAPPSPRGLFSSFNPLTPIAALIPAMVMVFALKDTRVNFAMLIAASLAMVAARATGLRTIISLAVPWVLTAVLLPVFRYNYSIERVSTLYDHGGYVTAASGIGALVALMLLTGISTQPEALARTLTTTFKLPYRITTAGTAAVAFITSFRRSFHFLRTARALRGIANAWGPLAPVVRWVGSCVPLAILAVRHGEHVALSMDTRGFGAYPQRTELYSTRWRGRDWLLVLALWAGTVALWWWRA